MHDVMRKRILRTLETLPEAQLYQVLDYVEFLQLRYGQAADPVRTGFQAFAERLEDRMRARSIAARTMSGTMKVVSTAGRMIDGLSGAVAAATRPLLEESDGGAARRAGASPPALEPARLDSTEPEPTAEPPRALPGGRSVGESRT